MANFLVILKLFQDLRWVDYELREATHCLFLYILKLLYNYNFSPLAHFSMAFK